MFLCKRKYLVRAIGSLIILTAMVLTGIRAVIHLCPPTQQIRNWIDETVPYPVVIQDLDIGWHHFTPIVRLSQVEVFPTPAEAPLKPALHIDKLQLRLNLWSLLWRKIELKALVAQGAALKIEESPEGILSLAQLPKLSWDPAANASQADKQSMLFPAIQTLLIQDSALTLIRKNGDQIRAHVDSLSGHVMRLVGITIHSHADIQIHALHYLQAKSQHKFNVSHFQGSLDVKKTPGQSSPRIEMTFKDLIIASPTHDLCLGPVTGLMNLGNGQAKLHIKSHHLGISLAQLFNHPLAVSDFGVDLIVEKMDRAWVVHGKSLKAHYGHTPILGNFKLQFHPDKALPTVDLLVDIGKMDVKEVLTAIPRVWMPHSLTQWLDSALVSGKVLSTGMVLRGDLSDFPFDNQNGIFEVYSEVENMHLAYDPHWPALQGLRANMLFRNRSMIIDGDHAEIEGGVVHDVEAIIPDLAAKAIHLTVDTQVLSTLEQGKAVLLNSPLQDKIGKSLSSIALKGPMELSLGLEIPLGKSNETPLKVRGLLELSDADLSCFDGKISLEDVAGELQFTESQLLAHDLRGQFLGGDHLFDCQIDFNATKGFVHINSKGKIESSALTQWQQLPDLPFLRGETAYQAHLDFSPQDPDQYHLSLQSTLAGVEIEAPHPFAKAAQDEKPLKLEMYFEPNDIIRFSAAYGDNISLAYSMRKGHTPQTMGAHLYLGEKQHAKFREDGIFLLDGDIKEVNFDAWKHFFNLWEQSMGQSMNKAYSVDPLMALNVEKLTINELPFENTKVEAEWQDDHQQWNIQLDGPTISGMIALAKDKEKALQIRLQKLILNTQDIPNLQSGTSKKLTPLEQSIDATITECRINDIPLSHVALKISGAPHGYLFDHFSASLPGADLNLKGKWEVDNDLSSVGMQGKMKIKNITEIFKALQKNNSINQAKGLVDFNLNWIGVPFKLDLASLTGSVDLRLEKGSIQGMNPGLGRILNLLNLDNMKRRLNLDFSDVTKNGFVFNAMTGRFQFGNGKVSSNDIMINGPSAKIIGFGQADLLTQGVRGEMTVMPNLTASLPMAAALAMGTPAIGVGAAVGAAVWVVDKMVGEKIQEINRFRYQVAGTWQSPQIEELRFSLNNPYT